MPFFGNLICSAPIARIYRTFFFCLLLSNKKYGNNDRHVPQFLWSCVQRSGRRLVVRRVALGTESILFYQPNYKRNCSFTFLTQSVQCRDKSVVVLHAVVLHNEKLTRKTPSQAQHINKNNGMDCRWWASVLTLAHWKCLLSTLLFIRGSN